MINKQDIRSLDICGLDTEGCVLKSAVDLFEIGITPRVLSNYCASSGGHDYNEAGIKILKRLIGEKQVI
jgi:nicotinamidase-related amidase